MTVHQCPRCELKFAREAEVKAHLVDDHDVDPEMLEEPLMPPQRHRRRATPPPQRDTPTDTGR